MSKFKTISLKQQDLDILEKMVIKCAKYENMLNTLKHIKEKLEQLLLNKQIGHIFSFFLENGDIYLENTHIQENFRKKRAVFEFLVKNCNKEKSKKLKRMYLDDNILGVKLYESVKAKYLKEWKNYHLNGKKLEKLCDLC